MYSNPLSGYLYNHPQHDFMLPLPLQNTSSISRIRDQVEDVKVGSFRLELGQIRATKNAFRSFTYI